MTGSLSDLWAVIGDAGSRLNRHEKSHFVQALACLGSWYSDNASLWTVMQWAWEEGELSGFPGTTPPLNDENFEEVLSQLSFSKEQCWQAIKEIAQHELAQTSAQLVALIK